MALRASVVVPTYNRAADLRECLEALRAQTLDPGSFEVIVVDDGSTDETAAVVGELATTGRLDLRYLKHRNQGPAAARNLGIQEARAEVIAFTDDDCLPDPEWLGRLLAALPDDPKCAGVGGRVVRRRDTVISRFIDHIGSLRHGQRGGLVEYLVTANALYRKAVLRRVGGFERSIEWPGGEDNDLSDRVRLKGYHFVLTDDAVIRHRHHDEVRGLYRMASRYGRGLAARQRLGRVPRRWYHRLPVFAVCCAGHAAVQSAKYAFDRTLPYGERLAYIFLRAVYDIGALAGYGRFVIGRPG
jgi:glycosyltransferase involved in cell wall biosynthesis